MAARGPTVAVPTPAVVRSGDVQGPTRAPRYGGAAAKDPRFRGMAAGIDAASRVPRAHPSGAQPASEAQASVKRPPGEASAQARADHAAGVESAPTKKIESNDFVTALLAQIKKVFPKDPSEAKDFIQGKKDPAELRREGRAVLSREAGAAKGKMSEAASAPQASTGAGAAPAPPPAPAAPTQTPTAPRTDTRAAAPSSLGPTPRSRAETSRLADEGLKRERLTPELLSQSGDTAAMRLVGQKQRAEVAAGKAELRAKTSEARLKGRTAAAAVTTEAAGARAQVAAARGAASAVDAQKSSARTKDEDRRVEVTTQIQEKYLKAESRVKEILDGLSDNWLNGLFDEKLKLARDAALATVRSYFPGWGQEWLNKFFKTETWDNACVAGEESLKNSLKIGLIDIGNQVQTRLDEARKAVAEGRKDVEKYVDGLKGDLREVGRQAQSEVDQKFSDLETSIDERKQEMVEHLAQRYNDALEEFRKELAESQKEAASTFDMFTGGLTEVAEKFKKLRDMLKSSLKKGEETIDLIIKNPKGFLANLGAAVKGGVMGFVRNFPSWMLKGVLGWLMGPLAEGGVEAPKDLTGPSLFRTAMSAIGLTWTAIRARIAKFVPESLLELVERSVEFARAFGAGDLMKIFAQLKDSLPDLKGLIIDAIISFLLSKVIQEAAKKLIAFSNPAGGVVEAVHAIVNFVSWLYNNAERLVGFVSTVIGAAHSIALGAIGGAITAIEGALGAILPIVISFFAAMAGLGGITGHVIGVIRKAAAAIDRALNNLIRRVLGPLVNRLKRQASKGKRASGKGKSTVPTKGAGAKGPSKGPSKGAGGGKKPGKPGTKPPRVGASSGKKPGSGGKKGDKGKDKEREKKANAARLRRAIRAVRTLLKAGDLSEAQVKSRLPQIQATNKLRELRLEGSEQRWTIRARVNPNASENVEKKKQKNVGGGGGKKSRPIFVNEGGTPASGVNAKLDGVTDWSRGEHGSFKAKTSKQLTANAAAALQSKNYDQLKSNEQRLAVLNSVFSKGRQTKDSAKVNAELATLASNKSTGDLMASLFSKSGTSLLPGKTTLLARRHIVSDGDLTAHYKQFSGMYLGVVYKKLTTMCGRAELKVGKSLKSPEELGENKALELYKGTIHAFHRVFFTWTENLWWGASPENSSYQEAFDPSTMMSREQLSNHIRKAEQIFGIPGRALKITLLDGSRVSVTRLAKAIDKGTFKDG